MRSWKGARVGIGAIMIFLWFQMSFDIWGVFFKIVVKSIVDFDWSEDFEKSQQCFNDVVVEVKRLFLV